MRMLELKNNVVNSYINHTWHNQKLETENQEIQKKFATIEKK